MVRIIITLVMLGWLFGSIGYIEYEQHKVKKKLKSCGYTIISEGKGVDCNGDTVTLVRNPPHGWKRLN